MAGQPEDLDQTASELQPPANESRDFVDEAAPAHLQESAAAAVERVSAELRELKLLQALSVRLGDDEDLATLLQEVIEVAVRVTHADMGTLQLLDESTGQLHIQAHVGLDTSFIEYFEAVESHSAASCGAALASGERVMAPDVQDSPVFAGSGVQHVLAQAGVRAVQSTPLVSRAGRLLGVFSTHYRAPTQLDNAACERLDFLARQTTDWIERGRLAQQVRAQDDRERLLWDAAAVLLRTDEPDAMLRELFAKISPQLGLDLCFNYTVDEDGKSLRLQSCIGLSGPEVEGLRRLEFGQGVCGAVARSCSQIVADHIQQSDDPRVRFVKALGVRAYVCNPLLADTRLLGTLSFGSRRRNAFSPDEIGFLQTICHYVTAAYERIGLIQRLRAADRRKDEFLAILAHELRNPLAPIRSGLDVMRVAGDDPQTVAEVLEVMERQVSQMTRLIDDLMDVSRISRGKLTLQPVPVELADVVSTAVSAARPQIDDAGHELQVDLPAEPVFLYVDQQRTVQILANLLWNAAKYTPHGGRISVSTETLDGRLAIKVRDSGMGIAREMQDSIFELFRQGAPSGNSGPSGLGIGLTLVKSLVEMHGGKISVASDGPGQGSEFRVELPLSLVPPLQWQPWKTADSGATGSSRRHRILVVDDNTAAQMTLRKSIELLGHDVQVASDGEEALQVAEEFLPELIFMDIGMPRVDGYEAARRLRQRPWGRDVLLVALTGYGQTSDKQQAFDSGFDHHITKPGEPGAVQRLISVLDGTSAHSYGASARHFPGQLSGGAI